jgi:hypothetical protein
MLYSSILVLSRRRVGQLAQVGRLRSPGHSGRREAAIRDLEVPGSMLAHRPGTTKIQ